MSYVARLNNVRSIPLYRSSFALMLTTGLNGILGFAYWVLAARLYPVKVVGIGAGAISAMTLVSSLGWVGLQFVLLRYVPVAGRAQARLVRLCYAAAIAIALVATGIFLAGFARLAGLGILTESPLTVLLFGASVVFWVVFSLQDPALIGLRRAGWVPIENTAFGAIKAVLLVALAASASAWAILGAWVLGLVGLVVVINVALFGRLLKREQTVPSRLPAQRQLVRFATGHHLVAVTAALPDSLVSLAHPGLHAGRGERVLLRGVGGELLVPAAGGQHVQRPRRRGRPRGEQGPVAGPAGEPDGVRGGDPARHRGRGGSRSDHGRVRPQVHRGGHPAAALRGGAHPLHDPQLRHRGGAHPGASRPGTADCRRVHRLTIGLDLWLIPSLGLTGAGWGWLIGQTLGAAIAVWLTLGRRSRS